MNSLIRKTINYLGGVSIRLIIKNKNWHQLEEDKNLRELSQTKESLGPLNLRGMEGGRGGM